MQKFICLCLMFMASNAYALKTSSNGFRVEDSKSGSVVIGSEHSVLEAGEVYKTIVMLWGNLDVHGQVEEVVLFSGKVTFHPGSKVTKNLVVIGGEFEAKPGAQVAEDKVVFQAAGPMWRLAQTFGNLWRNYYDGTVKAIFSLSFCLFLWVSGFLLFTLFPKLQQKTVDVLWNSWGKNIFAGFLGYLLMPALAVLLVLSIVGIIMLPFYVLLLVVSGYVAYLVVALWIGHRILAPKAKQKFRPLSLLIGIIILQALWYSGLYSATLLVALLWTMAWGSLIRLFWPK